MVDMMNETHVMVIVGARPQFVKGAALHRAMVGRTGWKTTWVHTGQHHDEVLSEQFFAEFSLPAPDIRLHPDPSCRAKRLGDMMDGIQRAIVEHQPDWVLVFGDTDSTLAGAWAAAAQGVPLVHVEAGLRSGDWAMPEEVNRVLVDRLSSVLICPTAESVEHLQREGITHRWNPGNRPSISAPVVIQTGDVMHDNALHLSRHFHEEDRGVGSVLLTMHRPSNVDHPPRLVSWLKAAGQWAQSHQRRVHFPVHPRTKHSLTLWSESWEETLKGWGIDATSPMGAQALLRSIHGAPLVLTDSGGVQKECYSLGTRCLVLRDTTEWRDQITRGHSTLVPEPAMLSEAGDGMLSLGRFEVDDLYGQGTAAEEVLEALERCSVALRSDERD
jgi:UDP-GlcNAc3NAcA epimerase